MKLVNGAGQMTPGTYYQGLWLNFPAMKIFQSVYDGFLKHTLSSSFLTARSEMGVSLMEILRVEY